jgi:membrane-bound lytic murein transglycosylase A
MRFRGGRICAGLSTALWLAACATTPPPSTHHRKTPAVSPPPRPYAPPLPVEPPIPVTALPGWAGEDHVAALRAFIVACDVAAGAEVRATCAAARAAAPFDEPAARAFLETRFVARPLREEGLLTGYFAPEYEARDVPDEEFSAPVRPRPPELTRGPDGRFVPWLTRAEIERSPADARAFMRPEDLFFMQIQGSGFLTFPDGRHERAAYSGDNGRPFTGIARPMTEKGLLPKAATSGEAIRAWLAEHRGDEAQAVTDLDERYVFFDLQPDDGGEPRGAAGVRLPAGRAGAVDAAWHGFGELFWISADSPVLSGAVPSYRRAVAALDSGGAIRGPVRVDLYLGRGPAAGNEAGHIRHPLKLWRIVPR